MKKFLAISAFILALSPSTIFAQTTVSRIYTNFQGFWTTSSSSINTVQPDTSHTLLAFTANGQTYSTGVNDNSLVLKGISFIAQDYRALPTEVVGANGIIGIASKIPNASVINDPIYYLTDGANGLDMGTAMFNWSGTNTYNISNINPTAIGDGIPDIIIPQLGDIPTGFDRFKFTTIDNITVGSEKAVQFSTINIIGNALWKFFSRTNPPTVGAATAGSRSIRMVAYDFADFGITTSNYTNITKFVHILSGNSDQPFVSYNNNSFTLLPIELLDYEVSKINNDVEVYWSTASETNNNYFSIERSSDNNDWTTLGFVNSKAEDGNSLSILTYNFLDKNPLNGNNYYRIKQTDFDGTYTYSPIKAVSFGEREYGIVVYPNPSTDVINILGLEKAKNISIVNNNGQVIDFINTNASFNQRIDISDYQQGTYYLRITNEDETTNAYKFIKQ